MSNRYYTITIKPTLTQLRGNKKELLKKLTCYLTVVKGIILSENVEDDHTLNVHLHALISCPLIKSKQMIQKLFFGYHIHSELVRKADEDMIAYVWYNYIHKNDKDIGDSTRFEACFGNAFI